MPSAVVLGGGGGIGAAVCGALAHTHAVVVGYHRNHERARSVVDKITAGGGTAAPCGADATTATGIDAAVTAADGLGPLRTAWAPGITPGSAISTRTPLIAITASIYGRRY